MSSSRAKKGITLPAAILILFIICFGATIYHLVSQKVPGEKSYVEGLSFKLEAGKQWRIGLPIDRSGKLRVSFSSDYPVAIRLGTSSVCFVDTTTSGDQSYTFQVDPAMRVVDVWMQNPKAGMRVTVANLTCTLRY